MSDKQAYDDPGRCMDSFKLSWFFRIPLDEANVNTYFVAAFFVVLDN